MANSDPEQDMKDAFKVTQFFNKICLCREKAND